MDCEAIECVNKSEVLIDPQWNFKFWINKNLNKLYNLGNEFLFLMILIKFCETCT